MKFLNRLDLIKNIIVQESKLNDLMSVQQPLTPDEICDRLGITGKRAASLARAFRDIENTEYQHLIEAWYFLHTQRDICDDNTLRLCLTGLDVEDISTYTIDTYQALLDLVSTAKKSITLVGYSFTSGNQQFIKLLEQRMADDGLKLTIVTNHLRELLNKREHQFMIRWLSNKKFRLSVYSYEASKDAGVMHVKCMVIDDDQFYLGSANFSYAGTQKNIEMGMVVKDKELTSKINRIVLGLLSQKDQDLERITYEKLLMEGLIR